ncbi:P-loop containing nucleoside triphosphate hydrolase protein [Dunaliella salina]|nr:P-loop containing nucleoside triphosphate hydrolase protein [Dunaliella salina]|eukprot:KAF5829815.1 P-loop containing nucleoside triphosphate hydrolase protein [Dunaliella salina]
MEMSVAGFAPPKPIKTFQQCGFDAQLMAAISKAGYERPTAIQCQALPAALSGRDVLGVAKTGSGKTAAFVLPMLVHIMDQRELDKGSGPIGLILAPTRELAEQIHKETRKFARAYSMRVSAAFGGLSKYEQVKDLKNGCEIAVATPGRMIDLIRMKACTLLRTTYLVLDEADRMFEMGFETQVRSILGQIRPDRQTLLFSATMPRKIQRLVADALTNPVHITVGIEGVANRDVRQEAIICKDEAEKMRWLMAKLQDLVDEGDVIVFASQRAKVDSLVSSLQAAGVRAAGIHGDMDQYSRMAVLDGFRAGQHHVLVATDVAARGLDIKTVKAVINFEAAKDIDTHIHRVGRTGRAGDKEGQAFSLLLPKDTQFASALVQSLALAGQAVPPELHELAMKDSSFRRGSSRGRGRGRGGGRGGGRKPQVGGAGLGFGSSTGSGGGGFTSAGKSFVAEGPSQVLPPPPNPQGGDASGAAAAAAASIAQRLASQGAGNSHQQQQQQLQQQAEGGRQFVANYHENRFRSSFVSSGTAGGSVGTGATVIAPKKAQTTASGAPLPPPPVPVTERPMYLQQQSFPAGRGGPRAQQSGGYGDRSYGTGYGGPSSRPQSFSNTSYHNAPPPPSVYGAGAPSASQQSPHQNAAQAGAAASAIEAAKAIAARLAAQGPGGGR